ncbi:hypothetical protein K431DRAFT_264161 [Polychaeton citri CBS 116435]|uniref:NADH-ubiquinone oxidoreductase 14 kDa subunit n=1 Tax=Polychaeton citri CBS 116435 TaxID=1314669 RepID=A0A9P4QC67_9PEZI|nr:hypothetical protein K431DRAFT_264161 [Polychaeton citri CBS 116435]
MVHKVLFWTGFGLAVRFWQLGIQMRPFLGRNQLWAYPIYGGLGASFGYWLQNVEQDQMRYLSDTRNRLLEKRRRRQEREGQTNIGDEVQTQQEGIFAHKKAEA